MGEKSTYFTTEFFAFFRDLAKNNNKEWFTKNKERYENVVQEPSLRFIRDAGASLQKISPYIVADARVDRRGVPATTAARIRPEPSVHPGPAAEGFHRDADVPRQPGHDPAVLRVVPRDVRVDGPAEPLPRGGRRASVVRLASTEPFIGASGSVGGAARSSAR